MQGHGSTRNYVIKHFSFCVQITILLPLIPGMKKLERLWQFYKALTISVTAAPAAQQRGQAGEPKEPHHLLFVAGAQAALQRNFLTSQAWCLRLVALKREKPMHKTFIYTSSSQLGSIKQQTTNMCQAITKTMSRVRGHGGPTSDLKMVTTWNCKWKDYTFLRSHKCAGRPVSSASQKTLIL